MGGEEEKPTEEQIVEEEEVKVPMVEIVGRRTTLTRYLSVVPSELDAHLILVPHLAQ